MQSILPVRGRNAALAALLLAGAGTPTANADGGGFAADPAALSAPVATRR